MTNYAQICFIFANYGQICGQKWSDLWPNVHQWLTSINVKYSGNYRNIKYFYGSNIFGIIGNYFWYLPFWTYCMINTPKGRVFNMKKVMVFHNFWSALPKKLDDQKTILCRSKIIWMNYFQTKCFFFCMNPSIYQAFAFLLDFITKNTKII